jgi:hypothetical protein
MTDLVKKAEGLPEPSRNEQIYARAQQLWDNSPQSEVQAALNDLNALARPATMLEIAKQLAVLIKCLPRGAPDDGEVFGRMLAEDAGAMQPSIGDLEDACRELRRNEEFCPVFCKVRAALERAKEHRQQVTRRISYYATAEQRRMEFKAAAEQERQRRLIEAHRKVQSMEDW